MSTLELCEHDLTALRNRENELRAVHMAIVDGEANLRLSSHLLGQVQRDIYFHERMNLYIKSLVKVRHDDERPEVIEVRPAPRFVPVD